MHDCPGESNQSTYNQTMAFEQVELQPADFLYEPIPPPDPEIYDHTSHLNALNLVITPNWTERYHKVRQFNSHFFSKENLPPTGRLLKEWGVLATNRPRFLLIAQLVGLTNEESFFPAMTLLHLAFMMNRTTPATQRVDAQNRDRFTAEQFDLAEAVSEVFAPEEIDAMIRSAQLWSQSHH